MSQLCSNRRNRKLHNSEPLHTPQLKKTVSSQQKASSALIEKTRQLMEQTIDFVENSEFQRKEFRQRLQASRPHSLDQPMVYVPPRMGIAFVSGLVQSPTLSREEEIYLFTQMNWLKYRAELNRRQLDLCRPNSSFVEHIERDLAESVQVRNRIVQSNLRLIVGLAKKLADSLEQMSDLIGEGMTPLIRSVELFNVSLGNRFSTYATWAVRNQMLRWLKRVRTSREFSPGEDAPSLENLPDNRPLAELADAMPQLRMNAVNRLLSSLSERERSILVARFGLDGQPRGQSLADIAEQVGLSKERVRQIVLVSLSKLRELMSYSEFESMG